VNIPKWAVDRVIERRGSAHPYANLDPVRTALILVDLQNRFMVDGVALRSARPNFPSNYPLIAEENGASARSSAPCHGLIYRSKCSALVAILQVALNVPVPVFSFDHDFVARQQTLGP